MHSSQQTAGTLTSKKEVNNEDEDVEEGELTESHSESHASSDDSPEDNGKQAVWSKKNDDSERKTKKIKGDDYSEKSRSSFSRERQSDKEKKKQSKKEEQEQEESGIKIFSQPSKTKGDPSNDNFKETVNVNSRNTNSTETKNDESQTSQTQNDAQDKIHPGSPSLATNQGQSSSVSQQENDSNLKDRSRSRSQSKEKNEKQNKKKKNIAGKKKKRSVGNSRDETSSSFSYNSSNFKSNRSDNKNRLEDDSSDETDEEFREEIRYVKVDQKGYKQNGNAKPKEDQKNRQSGRFSQKSQRGSQHSSQQGGRKRRSSSSSRSSESGSDDDVFFFKDLKGKPICSNFVQGKCLNRQACSQSHELINYPCKFKIAQGFCDKPTQSCLFNHETDQLGKKELFRFMMDNYTFLNNLQKQQGSTKIDKKFNNFKKKRELFTDISSQDKTPSALTQLPSCPPIQPPPPPPINSQQFRHQGNGPIQSSSLNGQQYPQAPPFQQHMQHRPLNGNPPPPYFQQQQVSQQLNVFPFYPRDGKPPFQGQNPINSEQQIMQNYHQNPNQQQIPMILQQPPQRQMQQIPPQNIQPPLHPHLQATQPQYPPLAPPFKAQPPFHQNQLPQHHQSDQVSLIEQNKKPAPPQIPPQFPQYDIQQRPPQQLPFPNQQQQASHINPLASQPQPPPPPPYYINNNNNNLHQQQHPQAQKQIQQFAPNSVVNGQKLAPQAEGMISQFNQYPPNVDSQHLHQHGQYPQNTQQPPMFSQMNGRSFDPNSQHAFQKQNGNPQANQQVENRYLPPPQSQQSNPPNPYQINSQPQQPPQNQQQFQQPLNQQKQPQFPQNNLPNGQYQPIQQFQPQQIGQTQQKQFPQGQPPQFPAPPANYQNPPHIGQQQFLGPNQQNVNNAHLNNNNYGNQGGINNGNGHTNRGEFIPSMPPLGQFDRHENNQMHQQPVSPSKQQKQLYSISSDQSDNRAQYEQRIKNGAEGPLFSQNHQQSVLLQPEQTTKQPPSLNQVADERMKEISIFSEKEKLNAISMCQLFSRNKGSTQFSQEQINMVLAMTQDKVQLLKAMVKSQDGEQFKQKIDEIFSPKSAQISNTSIVPQIQGDCSQQIPPQVEPVSKKNNLNESLLDIGIFGGNKKAAAGQGQQKIIQSTGQQTKVQQILSSKVDPRLAAKEKGAEKTKI